MDRQSRELEDEALNLAEEANDWYFEDGDKMRRLERRAARLEKQAANLRATSIRLGQRIALLEAKVLHQRGDMTLRDMGLADH